MSRTLVNRDVLAVTSETTSTRVTRKHGVPVEVREVAVVYLLDCGHETARKLPFNRRRPEVGARLNCPTCLTQGTKP